VADPNLRGAMDADASGRERAQPARVIVSTSIAEVAMSKTSALNVVKWEGGAYVAMARRSMALQCAWQYPL
jgi:hypothetical protein